MAPPIPSDNHKQLEILILSGIMCRINTDKPPTEVPEHVHLKPGLYAQDKGICMQS
jgi:hypothetical protein